MKPLEVAPARLSNQLLAAKKCKTPGEVVAWLGAVQAQDFAAANSYGEFLEMSSVLVQMNKRFVPPGYLIPSSADRS